MKQFLKYVLATVTGIVLVLIVVGILGAISLVGLAAKSAGSTQVEENSVYTLKLSGMLEERAANNPLAELTGQVSDNLGLDDLLTAIRKAKENETISTFLEKLERLPELSKEELAEISEKVKRFNNKR